MSSDYFDDKANLLTNSDPVCNPERLNYEEERIKTFASWPVHYPVDPVRLAKAGFYYTGNADEVVCFSCKGHIKNWNYGDIVLKKHSDLYPHCDFIKNISNNVPLLKTSIESKTKTFNIKNYSDKVQLTHVDYEKMKLESERLKTFEKWPLSNVNTLDLAHAGYFYTGCDSEVQCAFCKVIVRNFNTSNALYTEYLKHFPSCVYLSDKTKNITTQGENKIPWYQSSSQDICGNMKPNNANFINPPKTNNLKYNYQQHGNLLEFGIFMHKNSIHPYYASLLKRLGSFFSWPPDAPVAKEDLASAGFFYLGVDDRTVCFHCNGGLQKWEKNDDPWVEHARWFSHCDYVRLNKGSDFITDCLLKSTSEFVNGKKEISSKSDTSESLLKKLDEVMSSYEVRSLIESGIFPPYILRAAILRQIKETGSSFTNHDDLCVAASFLKDRMEKQYFDEKTVNAEDLNICLKTADHLHITEEFKNGVTIEQVLSQSATTSDEKNQDIGESSTSETSAGGSNTCLQNSKMQLDEKEDRYLCKICMDNELGVVFLPCGHLPACTVCAPALKHCPLCKKLIQATVRCYFP